MELACSMCRRNERGQVRRAERERERERETNGERGRVMERQKRDNKEGKEIKN